MFLPAGSDRLAGPLLKGVENSGDDSLIPSMPERGLILCNSSSNRKGVPARSREAGFFLIKDRSRYVFAVNSRLQRNQEDIMELFKASNCWSVF